MDRGKVNIVTGILYRNEHSASNDSQTSIFPFIRDKINNNIYSA